MFIITNICTTNNANIITPQTIPIAVVILGLFFTAAVIIKITADNNENIKLIGFTDKWPLLSLDLALTIGHAHLYNTHFDEHGNLHTTLIDWYDFDKLPETGFTNGINNNAYEQQERGDLTNYVLVIPIVLTKTEVDNL